MGAMLGKTWERLLPKILMLEFNEICPPLIERWTNEGLLPGFTEFHQASQVFTTVADEAGPPNLEPWIQWYSIHTGLPFRDHRVFHLTDGPKADHGDLWRELRSVGKTVMNCGSMNARSMAGGGTFYLPDPWCTSEPAFPPELEVYSKTVSCAVREYSRQSPISSASQLAAFLGFLLTHGLSRDTVALICKQLISERVSKDDRHWQRVALLDRLQFDVFRHYYRRARPDFATFFINSTAHLQHAYWREMDPEAFELKPTPRNVEVYGDAVLFGYRAMDALLREFMALADRDTILILCSALSQQPFTKRDSAGGQHFYRLRDPAEFLRIIGVQPREIEPVMTHQYVLRFASEQEADAASAALQAVRLGSQEVFGIAAPEDASLLFGCQISQEIRDDVELSGTGKNRDASRFFGAFYAIDATKSGCHHPEGLLWIRTGQHCAHEREVSILDIPATIIDLVGAGAAGLRTGARGQSLVPLFSPAGVDQKQAA
jgi:hypothetical protein